MLLCALTLFLDLTYQPQPQPHRAAVQLPQRHLRQRLQVPGGNVFTQCAGCRTHERWHGGCGGNVCFQPPAQCGKEVSMGVWVV